MGKKWTLCRSKLALFAVLFIGVASLTNAQETKRTAAEIRADIEKLQIELREAEAKESREYNAPFLVSKFPIVNAIMWDNLVWENIGIRYVPIGHREYEDKYKKFLSLFSGGVHVLKVRPDSPAEKAGITTGDSIMGIGQWAMTSADHIRYVGAQEWEKLQSKGESLRADVIRDNVLYATDIPTAKK